MSRRRWPRRAATTIGLACLLVGLAHPLVGAASDIWGNVGPASPLGSGGLYGRYPLGHYALDQHFDAVSASLTGGVDVSGVPPMIAYFLASVLWALTSFLASALISLFAFAFSLDLLNGSSATGGTGALAPVSEAIHSIYSNVLGAPWLVLAVALAGIWAMWRALVQRRYAETAGALGLSLLYVLVALFFVAEPAKTIGTASEWTNKMSVAFLSVAGRGETSGGERAREDAAQQLFDLLVFKPWAVMEFGGLEHCVLAGTGSDDSDPDSVAVRPLSPSPGEDAALARRLAAGTEVQAARKSCVNNANKYARRFLAYGLGTDERNAEYDALNHGDASELPGAQRSGYRLGVADKPATDAMEEGGQYQRLLIAIVVFCGELGAFCLLGALSVGVILAQVLLLLLLAFAPVALVAAAIPGRGHAFFRGWIEKLAGFLLRKAAYSLVLAVLLAVNGALAAATSSLGWLMSFGLQALFFWAVFLQRRQLTEGLVGIATGPGAPGREGTLRLLALYSGARTVGRPLRRAGKRASQGSGGQARLLGGGSGSRRGDRRGAFGLAGSSPRFGTRHSGPLDVGAPGIERDHPRSQAVASEPLAGDAVGENKSAPRKGGDLAASPSALDTASEGESRARPVAGPDSSSAGSVVGKSAAAERERPATTKAGHSSEGDPQARRQARAGARGTHEHDAAAAGEMAPPQTAEEGDLGTDLRADRERGKAQGEALGEGEPAPPRPRRGRRPKDGEK